MKTFPFQKIWSVTVHSVRIPITITMLVIYCQGLCVCAFAYGAETDPVKAGKSVQDSSGSDVHPRHKADSLQLSDIVVSASLYEQPLERLPLSASVISREDIENEMHSNIIDVLATTPGFTQIWEYHSPLLLRGMASERLIVMKNGNRRIGTFPGGYFAQDMNIYEAQRVEIIKGPGSVIYGSGAVSGIVNIVDRPLYGAPQQHAKVLLGFGGNNKEALVVPRLSLRRERLGVSLDGKFKTTGDIVYGDGTTGENSSVTEGDVSLSAGGALADNHTVDLSASYHYGDWGKPRGFNGPGKAFTEVSNVENRFYSALGYEWAPGGVLETLSCNGYVDWGTRDYYQYKHSLVTGDRTSLDLVHYKDLYGGGRLFARIRPAVSLKVTTGIDGYAFTLDNPADIIDFYNDIKGHIPGHKGAGQENVGAFVNSELAAGPKLDINAGVRGDYARVNEGTFAEETNGRWEERTAVSGNAGLVFSPVKTTHLSLNIGRAFRMPTAEELFTKVISCKGIKKGNPELQPEYSINIDAGLRGQAFDGHMKYDLALFHNFLDQYIAEATSYDPEVEFTYKNVDARILGGELSASYRFEDVFRKANALHAGTGVAYVYGIDLSGSKETPLFGVPPLRILADLEYSGIMGDRNQFRYLFKLQSEYAAAQDRVAALPERSEGGPWGYVPSESHMVFNCTVGGSMLQLPLDMKFRVHVKNILNTEYYPFGSYIPAMGRNIKATIMVGI